jgi:hypothetical protein
VAITREELEGGGGRTTPLQNVLIFFGVDLHPNKLLDSHLVTRIALISGGRECGVTAGNCKFLKAKPDNMYAGRKI